MGTRPEIIKNHSIIKALEKKRNKFYVLHTNQHSDYLLSQLFIDDLKCKVDCTLEGNYSIGKAIDWVIEIIRSLSLDLIIVNGDTAASLVGAIAAIYSDVGLAHVEAGLRSFDNEMYEERNRIMVDAASHYLFVYTDAEFEYLMKKSEIRGKIFLVGNTTVDFIEYFQHRITKPHENNYAYVTLHRKELTDRKYAMIEIFETLNELAKRFEKMIFPMHPRTRNALNKYGISKSIFDNISVCEPLSIFQSLSYQKHARIIFTDSGCVQEEACILGIPCVTIRNNTERQLTVQVGANVLSGICRTGIMDACDLQLGKKVKKYPPIYGIPGAGERIVDIIEANYRNFREY